MVEVIQGDCLDVLAGMDAESIDACCTDPPYHLASIVKRFGSEAAKPVAGGVYARSTAGFMGQQWDGGDVAFRPETWAAVLRVLKPGGYLLAFGGTRTQHRLVCAIEDAGFEVRDQIGWCYGSGFPKSHNLPNGLGTALKPAWEPICVARKPIRGTVAANVLRYGTGALNIDGCRVEGEPWKAHRATGLASEKFFTRGDAPEIDKAPHDLGRWPANLVHDGSDEVLACFPETSSRPGTTKPGGESLNVYGAYATRLDGPKHDDAGSAARFFYTSKASSSEREGGDHPTVKPVSLMRWLVRLVTPPGGTVLDPFAGSGTTGVACQCEGFDAVLIEREPKYVGIARRRLSAGPLFYEAAE